MNLKCLFFDVGSTLVNEKYSDLERISKLLELHNKNTNNKEEISLEKFLNQMKNESKKFAASPFAETKKYFNINYEIPYSTQLEELVPEAKFVLSTLSQKYKLGIIANQPEGLENRLMKLKIIEYFEPNYIFYSHCLNMKKPNIDFFKTALNMVNLDPESTIMIGDRLDNDIFPAKKCGMHTVWVKQGLGSYQDIQSEELKPEFIVNNIGNLLNIL